MLGVLIFNMDGKTKYWGKPSVTSVSPAFGFVASGLLAFGLVASKSVGFQFVFPRLMVLGFLVAGSRFFCAASGFP